MASDSMAETFLNSSSACYTDGQTPTSPLRARYTYHLGHTCWSLLLPYYPLPRSHQTLKE